MSFLILTMILFAAPGPQDYVNITVLDSRTKRGVPLVELKTVNNIRYYTDSAGRVAFYEPDLMNQQVYFHVRSHGYEYQKDGFGYRGARVRTKPGSQVRLYIKRKNIAERIYRVTGSGIYRDSQLLGKQPVSQLRGLVTGCDSVVNAVYRGKIYWFWGDTNRPSYPLGNFHVPGATSPAASSFDPDVGIPFQYFTNKNGFVKPTAKMPGRGPTWIDGLVVIKEGTRERLFAKYVKVQGMLKIYERGLVEFNPQTNLFEHRQKFDMKSPLYPRGHSLQRTDPVTKRKYIYFCKPYPHLRVSADVSHLQDLARYEVFSPFRSGSTPNHFALDRRDGKLIYAWRTNSIPLTPKLQARLLREGKIKPEEKLFAVREIGTNKPVVLHAGSVAWNAYLKRWIMVANQQFGRSFLGEVWLLSAPQLMGPWRDAVRIVTHDQYSFYNPKHHAMLDQQGGRIIYFEGTYSHTFSGNKDQTPRYDYNQIMYKLDLNQPSLKRVTQSPKSK